MKTKYAYIITILLLSFESATAQSEAGPFGGLQTSLSEFADAAAETNESLHQNYGELIRLGWLWGSDIRMEMDATIKGKNIGRAAERDHNDVVTRAGGLFWVKKGDKKADLEAEFDWQNMAEKMRAQSTSTYNQIGFMGGEIDTRWTEAQDHTMYIDGQGYWYTWLEGFTYEGFVRIDPIGAMQGLLNFSIEAVIDDQVTSMLDQLAHYAVNRINVPEGGFQGVMSVWNQPLTDLGSGNVDWAAALRPLVEELARSHIMQMTAFPAFIHFAYIISPTLARTQFNALETTVTWRGQDNCTKMSITSGEGEGYQLVFDPYGRLIYLKDADGDTAKYWYDRDVTVTIPPARYIDLNNPIFQHGMGLGTND